MGRAPRRSLSYYPWLRVVALLAAAPFAHAQGLFLDANDAAEIRGAVHQKREPWVSVQAALLAECDASLTLEPKPVEGRFRYEALAPLLPAYLTKGDERTSDRMRRDSRIVRDLGLGYLLTGKQEYAAKAVQFALAWVRSMEPVWPKDGPLEAALAMDATLPAMFYGWDLCRGSAARTPEADRAMAAWASGLLDTCKEGYSAVADATSIPWNMTFYATCAVAAGRPEELEFVYGKTKNEDTFQSLVPLVFDSNGLLNPNYAPDLGQNQDVYDGIRALKAFTYVAEIARRRGVNLYDWSARGRGLRRSYTAYAPWFSPGSKLSGLKGFPIGRDLDACTFEIAYAVWPDAEFERVIRFLDRPGYDPDILGPVALTHRYRGVSEQPTGRASKEEQPQGLPTTRTTR